MELSSGLGPRNPSRPFLNRIRLMTSRQIISIPWPTSTFTTDIVSGRVEISSRLMTVAIDAIVRTDAVISCSTEINLFISKPNLAVDERT